MSSMSFIVIISNFFAKKGFSEIVLRKAFFFFAHVSSEYADHFLFILEISRQNLLPCKNLLIILQVSLQQLRRIHTIRALAHAVAAVEAVLDLHHLRLDFRCELEVGRGSSEEKRHSRTGVDLDAGRAWHAVAAGTAEAAEQLLSVILDQGADLVIHHRRIVDIA